MKTIHNINYSLSVGLEVTNTLIAVLLVYGLLFCPSSRVVFLCLFFAVFGIFIAQVSHYCIFNHLQSTMDITQETLSRNRFEVLSDRVGKAVNVEPKAVYLLLLVMMHVVVLVGFYRLYTMLSKEKGFL